MLLEARAELLIAEAVAPQRLREDVDRQRRALRGDVVEQAEHHAGIGDLADARAHREHVAGPRRQGRAAPEIVAIAGALRLAEEGPLLLRHAVEHDLERALHAELLQRERGRVHLPAAKKADEEKQVSRPHAVDTMPTRGAKRNRNDEERARGSGRS